MLDLYHVIRIGLGSFIGNIVGPGPYPVIIVLSRIAEVKDGKFVVHVV
jgi:hypothetical protein